MSTYFLLDPFEFPYYFYRIREELIKVLSIVACIPSTQSRAESTRDTCNYGQYINQFPQNTIKVIREFEQIQKKICRHKMSIMFNENYIYTYIYEVHTIIFQPFFVWALLFIVHTWNSSPLVAMHLLYRSNKFWKAPSKSSCVNVSMAFVTASFISSVVS